jgi:hypothetical protein
MRNIEIEMGIKMMKIERICRQVLEETGWVEITTIGDGNAPMAGT